jgi:hypothetical protein
MTARRVSLLRMMAMSLIVAGSAAWAWFGGRAYLAVKRDEGALALIDTHKPQALLELHANEDARLQAGPVPIEAAMRRLATSGRTGLGSALLPEASNDTAPLMGWAFQPHDVPEWMMAVPADAGAAKADPASTR